MAPDGGGAGDTGGGDGPSGGFGGGRGADGDPDKNDSGGRSFGGSTAPETGPTLTQSQMDVLTQEAPSIGDPTADYDDSSSRTGPAPGPEAFGVESDYDDSSSRTGPAPGPEAFGKPDVSGSLRDVAKDVTQGRYNQNTAMNSFLGLLGMFAGPVGPAMGLAQGLRSLGISETDGPSPESGPGSSDNVLFGENAGVPGDQQPDVFRRPDAINAPNFLGFNPNMTDLQRRSQIATYGANSDDARYRDSDTAAYYRNLLQRNLINEDGSYNDISAVLPVEQRYLQNAFGLPQSSTTLDLLRAMSRA